MGTTHRVPINAFMTDSQRGEQSGLANLVKGTFGVIRNPTLHEAGILWAMSKERCRKFDRTENAGWSSGSRTAVPSASARELPVWIEVDCIRLPANLAFGPIPIDS